MDTANQDYGVKQRVSLLLFTLFGIPCFGLCAGLAAYHFHLRETLLSLYTRRQIGMGIDALAFALAALVVASVVRHAALQARSQKSA